MAGLADIPADQVTKRILALEQSVQKLEHRLRDEGAFAQRMNTERAWVEDKLRSTRENFDANVARLVEDALDSIAKYQIAELAKRVKRAMGAVVAKEVGLQIARLLRPAAPEKPKKKRRAG